MSNATHGNYDEEPDVTMRCYDRMPAALREFNRNAMTVWASGPQLKEIAGRESVSSYVEHMVTSDVQSAREDASADWGKQAKAYLAAQRPRRRRDWLDKPPRSRL